MRATALHPPPPTPITLMRVPVRASSSISYLRSFKSMSPSMMPILLLLQHFSNPGRIFLLQSCLLLELRRIHRQARGGTPGRIVHFERPVQDSLGESKADAAA